MAGFVIVLHDYNRRRAIRVDAENAVAEKKAQVYTIALTLTRPDSLVSEEIGVDLKA